MGKGSILMVRIMIIMVGMIIWRIWMIWIIVDDFECELIWKDTQQYNATMPGEGTEHCWYLWMIWLNISRTFMWRGRSRFFVPFSYQKKLCYWFFPFDRCWIICDFLFLKIWTLISSWFLSIYDSKWLVQSQFDPKVYHL